MKFEYLEVKLGNENRVQELNSLGLDSWELVCSLLPDTFLFKRSIVKRIASKKSKGFNFDELYAKYPRKIGKTEAYKRLEIIVDSEEVFNEVSRAIDNYSKYCIRSNTKPEYIKHFPTFLSSWSDWLDLSQTTTIVKKTFTSGFLNTLPEQEEVFDSPEEIKRFISEAFSK